MSKELYKFPNQYNYHGMALNSEFYPPDHIDKVRALPLEERDILIASFPRTGTTLVSHIISLITTTGNIEEVSKEMITKRFIYAERDPESGIQRFTEKEGIRYLKTHLPARLSQQWISCDKAKIVVVLRNPKDTLTSLYHFYKGLMEFGFFDGGWDNFFKLYEEGQMYYGDCLDWMLGWWALKEKSHIHVMYYEDVIRHTEEQITKLANFLGYKMSSEKLETIVRESLFSSMHKNEGTNIKMPSDFKPGFQFVRKGKIGDWKNHFNVAQNEWIDDRITTKLKGSGLKLIFE